MQYSQLVHPNRLPPIASLVAEEDRVQAYLQAIGSQQVSGEEYGQLFALSDHYRGYAFEPDLTSPFAAGLTDGGTNIAILGRLQLTHKARLHYLEEYPVAPDTPPEEVENMPNAIAAQAEATKARITFHGINRQLGRRERFVRWFDKCILNSEPPRACLTIQRLGFSALDI